MKSPKSDERPIELAVPLKSGKTVIVREMNWQTYKRIKTQVVQLLAERLNHETLVELFAIAKSTNKAYTGLQAIRTLGVAVLQAIDDLTPVLVAGCVPEGSVDVETLPPVDVYRLREACTKVNDLEALLGLEGNAIAATVQRLRGLMAAGGGSQSSQPSPPDTAGVSLT